MQVEIKLKCQIFLKSKYFSGHGEANGVGGSLKLKRKRSESQMEVDHPTVARPNKK